MKEKLTIAISSGKGGTGKTFISTNLARVFSKMGKMVRYIDCDVEEPNGHLFLEPEQEQKEIINILSPSGIDENKCNNCGKCVKACKYNAIAMMNEKFLLFQNLCHVCGACTIVCPKKAIIKKNRNIGELIHAVNGNIKIHYALLETGEGGMALRLVRKVKENIGEGINILDSAPGTSCTVVETVRDSDLCVLVTDPTPFGINDLKLAVDMCREIGVNPVVLINRAEYLIDELKGYCENENLEIIGEIPDDRKIAKCYSNGGLAFEKLSEYRPLLKSISQKILELAESKTLKSGKVFKIKRRTIKDSGRKNITNESKSNGYKPDEIVIISGKGGTGKSSLAAAFTVLSKEIVISDCDVDAADLHLILNPNILDTKNFSGGEKSVIDSGKCTYCGECYKACRFDAVIERGLGLSHYYIIDPVKCEGCGVCSLVCNRNAIIMNEIVNGEVYISETLFGPMSHAKLGVAEENSGKLVSCVRNQGSILAKNNNIKTAIIDGSPGTGCPVIASLTGTDYAIIVTEPTVSGIHDMKRILNVTKFFQIKSGIIVNKYNLNLKKSNEIEKIASIYNCEYLGRIPYDKSITEAQVNGVSIIEYTENRTTKTIMEIWNKVKEKV